MNVQKAGMLPTGPVETANRSESKNGASFGEAITGAMNRISKLEKDADTSVMDLLQGKADIHETMIALQKVDISVRLLLSIRNKAIESYKEIMHMQF